MYSLISQIKVETLYYFYSAVFQGFAAIFTLMVMLILYFLEKIQTRKYWDEEKMEKIINNQIVNTKENPKELRVLKDIGVYAYAIKKEYELRNMKGNEDKSAILKLLIAEYDKNNESDKAIRNIFPFLVIWSFSILLVSFIALLAIDVSKLTNSINFFVAIQIISSVIGFFLTVIIMLSNIFNWSLRRLLIKMKIFHT